MNRLRNFLPLALILLLLTSFAPKNDKGSIVRIRLSDGFPLLVTINGRDFQKTGRSITISDIPRKRQYIEVYRFRAYADGNGGKAEKVYSGTVKLEKGATYDCIVDVGMRKFRMKQVSGLAPLTEKPPFDPRRDQPIGSSENENADGGFDMPPARQVSSRLQPLKTAMDRTDEDGKKLEAARNFASANTLTSEETATIAEWIFFDDNRMLFIKAAYSRVSDKANFRIVRRVFTLEDSKKEFDQFVAKQTK